jgi:hypothetical protein
MTSWLKKQIWQRVLLVLTIILLILGPVIFHELEVAAEDDQAPITIVIGPQMDTHGTP